MGHTCNINAGLSSIRFYAFPLDFNDLVPVALCQLDRVDRNPGGPAYVGRSAVGGGASSAVTAGGCRELGQLTVRGSMMRFEKT